MSAPVLADGIARYVELFRASAPAPDIETLRLTGDLTADRFTQGFVPDVRRFDTCVVAPGREIPVRIFDPGGDGARPAICYFHGGGFALGSVASFDLACAALAEAAGAVVASVHYRRLPDVDYPAAQDDCDLAHAWLTRQAGTLGVDPARIGVAGDSVGALFAITCAAQARAAAVARPAFQLLFYGTYAMDPERPDYLVGRDPLLTGDRVRQYIALFHRCGGCGSHPAPVDRTDLTGLPPTHLVIAEHDPLAGEALEYARLLHAAGVDVTVQVAKGMIHGFLRAVGVSPAARAELATAVAGIAALSRPPSARGL